MRTIVCICASLCAAAVVSIAAPATAAAAVPPCYGAAAFDPVKPCTPPVRDVYPPLDSIDSGTSYPCDTFAEPDPILACTFGARARKGRRNIALVGDSHALQWRVALDVVARRQRWRGFSITTAGCPFSAAVERLPEGLREQCVDWYGDVQRWFRRHPEVNTVFVSSFAPLGVEVKRGQTQAQVKIAGFKRAWRRLPRSVRHIVVLRDNPLIDDERWACINRVIPAGVQPLEGACPISRRHGVKWDMAVTAAKALRSRRYASIDLTSFFCGPRLCPSVIGGVLVYRDPFGHMTNAFSGTLAPYVQRRLRALMARW